MTDIVEEARDLDSSAYSSPSHYAAYLEGLCQALADEIERLRQEKVDILAAKEVIIAPPAIPEGFVIDQLSKTINSLYADIARIREGGQKDYEGMREFQRKFIDRDHEVIRLRGLLRECIEWIEFKEDGGLRYPELVKRAREALGDA